MKRYTKRKLRSALRDIICAVASVASVVANLLAGDHLAALIWVATVSMFTLSAVLSWRAEGNRIAAEELKERIDSLIRTHSRAAEQATKH